MPRIAKPYDYPDVSDPRDAFDRFEQRDCEPRDKGGRFAERGRPFTQDEIDAFLERGGAISICPTPVQPEPDPPGLSKIQEMWALTFDPMAGLSGAIAICRERIGLIKATSGRDRDKAQRVRSTVKGILEGLTFADVADELCLDRAFLSRTMAAAYAKWPDLERPLKFINLTNDQARRKCGQQSTQWHLCLRKGGPILDEGVLIWGRWPGSGPDNHVADPDHVVKLAELQHKAFPPIRSNFGAAVAGIGHVTPGGEITREGAPSRGSQRIERIHHDRWGYEIERTDGSVRIGAFRGRLAAIDAWQQLRERAGLPDKYFHEETEGSACIWPLPDVGELRDERAEWAAAKMPSDDRRHKHPRAVFDGKSFTTAARGELYKIISIRPPRIHPLHDVTKRFKTLRDNERAVVTYRDRADGEIVAVDTPLKYKAPPIPFVNEHRGDKLKKGVGKYNTRRGVPILCGDDVIGHWWAPRPPTLNLSEYPARLTRFRGKRLRTKRWAVAVFNAGVDATTRYNKMFGHLAPPKGGGEIVVFLLSNWERTQAPGFEREMIAADAHCCVNAQSAARLGMSQTQVAYRAQLAAPTGLTGTIKTVTGTRCTPRNLSLPKFREDELVTGWPILMPSTYPEASVLFVHQVTQPTEDHQK